MGLSESIRCSREGCRHITSHKLSNVARIDLNSKIFRVHAKISRSRLKINCGLRSLACIPLTLTGEPHKYTLHTLEVQFLRSFVPKNSVLLHLATIQTR